MLVRKQVRDRMSQMRRLAPEDTFCFRCHQDVPCLNACCADSNVPLTPYDVVRLRDRLGQGSDSFLAQHTVIETSDELGVRMVHLAMESEDHPLCPFAKAEGCAVYQDRPSACRTFPLGRSLRAAPDGKSAAEEYVLLDPPFCKGFVAGSPEFTATGYVEDQGLEIYHRFNNRYMGLLVQWQTRGLRAAAQTSDLIFTALYRVDAFAEVIEQQDLLAQSGAPERLHDKILSDEPQRLWFAFKFLERML
jgi:Fe-S-cluster containining protein